MFLCMTSVQLLQSDQVGMSHLLTPFKENLYSCLCIECQLTRFTTALWGSKFWKINMLKLRTKSFFESLLFYQASFVSCKQS